MMRKSKLSLSKLRIKTVEQIKLLEIKDLKLEENMKVKPVEDRDKPMV